MLLFIYYYVLILTETLLAFQYPNVLIEGVNKKIENDIDFNQKTSLLLSIIAEKAISDKIELQDKNQWESLIFKAFDQDNYLVHQEMYNHLKEEIGVKPSCMVEYDNDLPENFIKVIISPKTDNLYNCDDLFGKMRLQEKPTKIVKNYNKCVERLDIGDCNNSLPSLEIEIVDYAIQFLQDNYAMHDKTNFKIISAEEEKVTIYYSFNLFILAAFKTRKNTFEIIVFKPKSDHTTSNRYRLNFFTKYKETMHIVEVLQRESSLSIIGHSMKKMKQPLLDTIGPQFKSMTYNVWNFDNGPNWPLRSVLLANQISLANPDILGLQELRISLPNKSRSQIEDLAKLLPQYPYWQYHFGMIYINSEEGLAIMSKYPFSWTYYNLPKSNSDKNQRIILHATLPFSEGGNFDFFNTHWTYDKATQLIHAHYTCNYTRQFDSSIQILEGDLNIYADFEDPATFMIDECNFTDSWSRVHSNQVGITFSTLPTIGLLNPADRLFFKSLDGIVDAKSSFMVGGNPVNNTYPSDHFGLYSQFFASTIQSTGKEQLELLQQLELQGNKIKNL
jgi:endonuclease/exonuclease/phosphatase family metal-dependent hydrolase